MYKDRYEKCEKCKNDLTEKNFGVGQMKKGVSKGFCLKCIGDGCYITNPKGKEKHG